MGQDITVKKLFKSLQINGRQMNTKMFAQHKQKLNDRQCTEGEIIILDNYLVGKQEKVKETVQIKELQKVGASPSINSIISF